MPKRLPITQQLTDANHDQWCWAAVAATVGEFKDQAEWRQCVVAQRTLHNPACCDPGRCNQPGLLDQALGAVQHFFSAAAAALGMARIRQEIDVDRPIGVRIGWAGGGVGHFVLIIGYDEFQERVDVADPKFGESSIPLSVLQSSYKGLGSWTDTYFTF